MTHQFNLLPAPYVEKMAERRLARVAGAALLLLVGALAMLSMAQTRQLSQAERVRTEEQARNTELLARLKTLAPVRQLTVEIGGRERVLSVAMGTQVSWAATLSSLSTTFPADTALTSFNAESTLLAFGAVPPVEPGDGHRVIGSTSLTGYSVESFTPGVERLLQLLDAVSGLTQPRLQIGAVELMGELPVTTFDGTTFIDGSAVTGRFADGLPPEKDVALPRIGAGPAAAAPAATRPLAAK